MTIDNALDRCLRGVRLLTITVASVALLASSVQASTLPDGVPDSARSGALGGHGLIGDIADVYTFPQATLDHTGIGQLNVDRSLLTGSALVVMEGGDDAYAASIYTHDIAGATVAHLHWARPMDENRLGVSLVVGKSGTEAKQEEDTVDLPKDEQWSFGLGIGYSIGATDLSLEVYGGETNATCEATAPTCPGGTLDAGIQLNARSLGAGTEGMTFGWTAALGFKEVDHPEDPPGVSAFHSYRHHFLDVRGGFGPVFRKDGAVAALQGVVGLTRSMLDPDGGNPDGETDDEIITDLLTVPGVELAGEFPVANWLTLRASTGYRFQVTVEEAEATKTVSQVLESGGLSWAAGAGLHFDNLDIDLVLNNGFTVNGPRFVGGQVSGLASQASLNLSF